MIWSISIGASVYFKKLPVGKVYDYRFVEDGKKVSINIVVDKAYAHFVKKDSHFWNISGLMHKLVYPALTLT